MAAYNPSVIEILVLALATWRLSSLFARESGPGDMFGNLRDKAPEGIKDGLECMWCNSVWVGMLVGLLYFVGVHWILLPFALSALTIMVEALCAIAEGEV